MTMVAVLPPDSGRSRSQLDDRRCQLDQQGRVSALGESCKATWSERWRQGQRQGRGQRRSRVTHARGHYLPKASVATQEREVGLPYTTGAASALSLWRSSLAASPAGVGPPTGTWTQSKSTEGITFFCLGAGGGLDWSGKWTPPRTLQHSLSTWRPWTGEASTPGSAPVIRLYPSLVGLADSGAPGLRSNRRPVYGRDSE